VSVNITLNSKFVLAANHMETENMKPEIILETLHLKLGKKMKRAKANLFVYEFEDNGFFISYNQSLQLSAYGKTQAEAEKRFAEEVFPDFCEHLTELSEDQIFAELKKLGWKRSPFFKKELSNTAYVDREGILKNFNLPTETKVKEQYVTV